MMWNRSMVFSGYNSPHLVRSLQCKGGLIGRRSSLNGENLISTLYLAISVHFKSGLIRGMSSLEGDNLVIFYYLSTT